MCSTSKLELGTGNCLNCSSYFPFAIAGCLHALLSSSEVARTSPNFYFVSNTSAIHGGRELHLFYQKLCKVC